MMKKLLVINLIFCSGIAVAQQTNESGQEVQHYSVGVKKTEAQTTTQNAGPRTIEQIDAEIKSIEIKYEIIEANPQEDSIARAQGWYDQMDSRLEKLKAERIQLKERNQQAEQEGGNKKQIIKRAYFDELPESKQQIILNNPEIYVVED